VLDVTRAEEFGGGLKILLIDGRVVEFQHGLLILFHLFGVGSVGGRRQGDDYQR
jgi:hypothetical protein